MFDYLERGDPLADFFVDFPSVQPALVRTLLEEAQSLVVKNTSQSDAHTA